MSIQPGVGYNFTSSGSGTSIDINQPWSPFTPNQSILVPDGGGETDINEDPETGETTANFSKLRVICRSASNSLTSCLREYNLVGMAVYPTGSKNSPTTPNPSLIDEGATFTLVPPSGGATTKEYVFSIILNHYNIASGTLTSGVPYAALMEVGGDAHTKTTPFNGEPACDRQDWVNAFQIAPVSISIPDAPFEVNGNLEIAQANKLKNYNCQRLRIATIAWNNVTSSWNVIQHLIGPITIPFNIFYEGPYRWEDSDTFTPPSWWTTPDNADKQADWEGTYSDSTKWSGGANPTESITV
jgi:hypothetical protein